MNPLKFIGISLLSCFMTACDGINQKNPESPSVSAPDITVSRDDLNLTNPHLNQCFPFDDYKNYINELTEEELAHFQDTRRDLENWALSLNDKAPIESFNPNKFYRIYHSQDTLKDIVPDDENCYITMYQELLDYLTVAKILSSSNEEFMDIFNSYNAITGLSQAKIFSPEDSTCFTTFSFGR